MIPVRETLLEYRGSRFSWFSGGDDHVYVRTDGPPVHDDFPDAVEFSDDAGDPWVKLPRRAISARYSQRVTGTWHGVPVTVSERVRGGLRRGMVEIWYAGTEPDAAVGAGFSGNQNDGWSALVSPDEVADVRVEITRHPMTGSCRRELATPETKEARDDTGAAT